jgi:hypothetical protein
VPDLLPPLPKFSSSALTLVGYDTNRKRLAAKIASPVIPITFINNSKLLVATI